MWSKLLSSNEECESPPVPVSLASRHTLLHTVIVHVMSVVDHGSLMYEDLPDAYLPFEGACLSRCLCVSCGRVDDIGPGGDAGCSDLRSDVLCSMCVMFKSSLNSVAMCVVNYFKFSFKSVCLVCDPKEWSFAVNIAVMCDLEN